MQFKFVLTVRDPKTKELAVEESEIVGPDAFERAFVTMNSLLRGWVLRDGMELRSLTLEALDK